jgi:NAD(P)-dependent dehydrogenase (short-subunit alcohol dehydrogenase family)
MIKYDFKNKNVIVTGAANGLGKCVAEQFALAGANVVIADLNIEVAKEVATNLSKYNTKILPYKIDVSNYNEFEQMVNFTLKEFNTIDILINNAGICKSLSIEDMDIEISDKMVDINLNGTIYGCKAVLPYMKKQQYGKIVNLSSIAAKLGSANVSVYSATKAAVLELTACLAREYAAYNININCVLPGIIRTPLWENMLNEMTGNDESKKDDVFASFTNGIPKGVPQEPIDIANAILFLCTDEASNITAQNLGIDGGQTY